MFAMLVGYEVPDLLVLRAVPPVIGTVLFVWGGRPFLVGAVGELRARRPGMMLLIALAITVAFLASWGATLGPRPRTRLLVGAGAADRHHAPRPLDRDALPGSDDLRARLARRAAPRFRRALVGDDVAMVAPADPAVGDPY
jgi:Cu2+-exporting ATPase